MKLKKKHKYKIRIILYLCFFLLTISIIYVCYFIITNLNLFLSDNSIHPKSGIASIESLSIPEIVYFLPTFNKTNDEINSILDQKFKLLRCSEEELINFSYSEGLFCDFDSFSHYVEGKVLLGKKSELKKDSISLLNRTYNEYKTYYAGRDKLHPTDNKWNHIINAMIALDLLDEKEKEFWIIKYSFLKLDEDKPKFPQSWNRIWLFKTFGVDNIYILAKNYDLNLSEVKENVCNYIPSLNTYKEQNIFKESEATMFRKYMAIKKFCTVLLTEEDMNEYIKISSIPPES